MINFDEVIITAYFVFCNKKPPRGVGIDWLLNFAKVNFGYVRICNDIENLQDNGFLKLKGKYFEPTEKARMAVKILPDEMIYPDTTALWNNQKGF